MHSELKSLLFDINPIELEKLRDLARSFQQQWTKIDSLKDFPFPNTGAIEDIRVIDYVEYEQLYGLFESIDDFITTGGVLIGNCLANLCDFKWRKLKSSFSESYVLEHQQSKVVVPIFEITLNKFSSRPQFETFETLFFDILLSADEIERTYPMNIALSDFWNDENNFERLFGHKMSKSILELYLLYSLPNEEDCVRRLGLDVYKQCAQQDWAGLKTSLLTIGSTYKLDYGSNWEQRYRKEEKDLFENFRK